MKIVSFGPPRAEQPGVLVDKTEIAPLAPLLIGAGITELPVNSILSLLPPCSR